MKYSVVLLRSFELSEAFEGSLALPDGYIGQVEASDTYEAVTKARAEASKADKLSLRPLGYVGEAAYKLTDPENYQVVAAFEGHPKITYHPGTSARWT